MSEYDPKTLAFYAAQAEHYVGARPAGIWPDLIPFLARLPKGAKILELGSGGGIDADYMINAGFDVHPTDGVPEMAAQAEARLGRPVRVMRFEELDEYDVYDAVVASASLLHVPHARLIDVLTRVWHSITPGGWHIASYKTGGGEGYDEFGRYYNRPSAEQAEAYYRAAGQWSAYQVLESFERGHFGKPSAWLTITAQKQPAH